MMEWTRSISQLECRRPGSEVGGGWYVLWCVLHVKFCCTNWKYHHHLWCFASFRVRSGCLFGLGKWELCVATEGGRFSVIRVLLRVWAACHLRVGLLLLWWPHTPLLEVDFIFNKIDPPLCVRSCRVIFELWTADRIWQCWTQASGVSSQASCLGFSVTEKQSFCGNLRVRMVWPLSIVPIGRRVWSYDMAHENLACMSALSSPEPYLVVLFCMRYNVHVCGKFGMLVCLTCHLFYCDFGEATFGTIVQFFRHAMKECPGKISAYSESHE